MKLVAIVLFAAAALAQDSWAAQPQVSTALVGSWAVDTSSVAGGGGGSGSSCGFSRLKAWNSTGAARSPPKAPGTGVPSARPIQTPTTWRPSNPIAQASRWP